MRKTQLKRLGGVTSLSILLLTGLFVCYISGIITSSGTALATPNSGFTSSFVGPTQFDEIDVKIDSELECSEDVPDLTSSSRTGLPENPNQVLEWNQIFIDTLIATNTANSSSQRLGAIVHTAIFDAYNGVERRYTPIFVHDEAPRRTSRRAAVIAAAYTALVGLFPSRQTQLDESYAASLAALSEDCEGGHSPNQRPSCTRRIERGIAWGTEVAQAVLAWRATDGFSLSYPAFTGGTRGRPVAADTAGVRSDERAGLGIYLDVRSGK